LVSGRAPQGWVAGGKRFFLAELRYTWRQGLSAGRGAGALRSAAHTGLGR